MVVIIMRNAIFAALLALAAPLAFAEDLGAYGNVYPIAEPDMINFIKAKLKKKQDDGSLKKIQDRYIAANLAKIENPDPVPGIAKVMNSRTWYFDPTMTVQQDFTDHLGRIVVKKGTKVNPLDYQNLTKSLVFIDARDEKQVKFADEWRKKAPLDKIILVGGSPTALMRKWNSPVFYDQKGRLTTHFSIKAVPAVVGQDPRFTRLIRVDEVSL
jgi:conjugal transfer pilus assembly protein TraW